jgi:hypothetical protein
MTAKDGVPIVSAQFYRPDAGHPFNFTTTVPTATGNAGKAKVLQIKLANGGSGRLYHVTMPLDRDAFSWFTDLNRIAYSQITHPNWKGRVGQNLGIVACQGSRPDRTSEMAIDRAPNFRRRSFGSNDQASSSLGRSS